MIHATIISPRGNIERITFHLPYASEYITNLAARGYVIKRGWYYSEDELWESRYGM